MRRVRVLLSSRRSLEARVGLVALRTLGSTSACRISSASRSSASRRFCSCVRWLRAMISSDAVVRDAPAGERTQAAA